MVVVSLRETDGLSRSERSTLVLVMAFAVSGDGRLFCGDLADRFGGDFIFEFCDRGFDWERVVLKITFQPVADCDGAIVAVAFADDEHVGD